MCSCRLQLQSSSGLPRFNRDRSHAEVAAFQAWKLHHQRLGSAHQPKLFVGAVSLLVHMRRHIGKQLGPGETCQKNQVIQQQGGREQEGQLYKSGSEQSGRVVCTSR